MENRIAKVTGVVVDMVIQSSYSFTVQDIKEELEFAHDFEDKEIPDRSTIYRILRELEDLDLVKRNKKGSNRWYRGDRFYDLRKN